MLHELIMALSGVVGDVFEFDGEEIKKFEFSKVKDFQIPLYHPSERAVINEILEIGTLYKRLEEFLVVHQSINTMKNPPPDTPESLKGVYVHGFCNGVREILDLYNDNLAQLELKVIGETYSSLNEFRAELNHFVPIFKVLLSIVKSIKSMGKSSAIVVEIVKNELDSNVHIQDYLKLLTPWMNRILYKHITNWVVFGNLSDPRMEFFIQKVQPTPITREDSETFSSAKSDEISSMKSATSTTCISTIDQQYILDYSLVPSHFPHQLIERIMFIGNSVTILKDSDKTKSVITEKQKHFYEKMLSIPLNSFDIVELNQTIEELALSIGKDLHHLVVTETDLFQHLTIVKDFYLTGRGELFHDFLHILSGLKLTKHSYIYDMKSSFQFSASRVHVQEDVMQGIDINITSPVKLQPNSTLDNIIPHLYIEMNHEWPLHILFTPDVIKNYNQIFQFLLKIRFVQLELSKIWSDTRKVFRFPIQKGPAELRNLMYFFINHLQHYFQEDVLEKNFEILKDKIEKSENFDQVRIAHCEFQSNIICQLFITLDEINKSMENLLNTCCHFIRYMKFHLKECEIKNLPVNEGITSEISKMGTTFWKLMHLLMSYFKIIALDPKCGQYLGQLILRLDFNGFFSESIRHNFSLLEDSSLISEDASSVN